MYNKGISSLRGRNTYGNEGNPEKSSGKAGADPGAAGGAPAGHQTGGQPLGDRRDTAQYRYPQAAVTGI